MKVFGEDGGSGAKLSRSANARSAASAAAKRDGENFMKQSFSKREAAQLIESISAKNDIVRLVEPATQKVLSFPEGREDLSICCHFWGRCERCENCTSLKALQTKGRAFKLEHCRNHTYFVTSRYLSVDGVPCIMEVITDVTDRLLPDSTQKNQLGKLIHHYHHLLMADALTGLYRRRFLDESFVPSLQCCREHGTTVNLAMLDLDDFKKVNDRYGHPVGDSLLKDVGGYWKRCFDSREKEKERLVIRYGGDELLVVVCGISLENFQSELRGYYQQMRKICYCGPNIQIPFSMTFGVASSEELQQPWDWENLLQLADCRMYWNQRDHKNQ
jgi:putative two-component system response regulator